MNILLTGSTGFLGVQVQALLRQHGHNVLSLTRPETDLLKPATLHHLVTSHPRIDRIVHLAAEVPKTRLDDSKKLYTNNIRMTQHLLQVFGSGAQGIIYASTIEVYGLPSGTKKISEHTPVRPKTWYGKSKYQGEVLCQSFGQSHAIPVSVLRFASLYGAGDTISRAIPNFIKASLAGNDFEIRNGNDTRDYLYKEDAARAILLAVQKNLNGIFCIGTGRPVTIRKAAVTIAKRINPALTVGETSSKSRHDLVYSITKAKRILGFSPSYVFPDHIEEEILEIQNNMPSIVFDLDGTILDVSKRYWRVYRDISFSLRFIPLPLSVYWTKKRNAIPIPHTKDPAFRSQFIRLIEQPKYLALDTIYPQINHVLEEISQRYPLTLVTLRKNRKNLLHQLATLSLDALFPVKRILTPKDPQDKIRAIAKMKPHPLAVVGDTHVDIAAAQVSGIPSITLTWGLRSKQILSQKNPSVLVSKAKTLHAIIDQIIRARDIS